MLGVVVEILAGYISLEVSSDKLCITAILFFNRYLITLTPRVGEFSSPKQGTFYHYNDFWHLDPATREWNRMEIKKGGPPARSGHRMTYFKASFR